MLQKRLSENILQIKPRFKQQHCECFSNEKESEENSFEVVLYAR